VHEVDGAQHIVKNDFDVIVGENEIIRLSRMEHLLHVTGVVIAGYQENGFELRLSWDDHLE
jgi:hypothetical protein